MAICSTCGCHIDDAEEYCPNCGRRYRNRKLQYGKYLLKGKTYVDSERTQLAVRFSYLNQIQALETEIRGREHKVRIQSILAALAFYLLFIINFLISFLSIPDSLIALVLAVPMFSFGILFTIRAMNPEFDKQVMVQRLELYHLIQMKFYFDGGVL